MTAGIPDVPGQSAPERLTGPSAKSDDLAVLRIRAIMDHEELRFEAELADHDAPLRIGPSLDLRALSDEAGALMDFTGTMVGVACQDLSGARLHADFRDFRLHYG
jgi:xylan 1,4-beta-xylosidase